jgi:DNA-directed RNA polymerase specialized sigma subunit
MENLFYNLAYVALGALLSWYTTEKYFQKSMRNQETEQSKQIEALKNELKRQNTNSEILQTQNYIDEAVKAWKHQGTAVHYLNSLELPNNQKSEILLAAALRHKGRSPKNNPYT